jgi:hypothetical protein
LKISLGLIRPIAFIAKNGSKNDYMSIINGLNKYTGHIVLRKGIKWLSCLKITICRTGDMKLESDIYKTMETKKDFCLCHTKTP